MFSPAIMASLSKGLGKVLANKTKTKSLKKRPKTKKQKEKELSKREELAKKLMRYTQKGR